MTNLLDTADQAVATLDTYAAPRQPRPAPIPPPEKPAPRPRPAPVSQLILLDGRLAIAVALKGTHGEGCSMLVDEWRWPTIRAVLGDQWGVRIVRDHRYVVSRGRGAGRLLARWVAGATPGQVVSYRNGDTMDIRASNLILADGREFVAGVFGHAGDVKSV